MKRLVAGLCLAIVLLTGCQSTGDVRGRLVSQTSGKPIAGAAVKLPSGTVTTDADGAFTAIGITLGEVQASISASGFEAFSAALTAAKSGAATVTIELPDASVQLRVKEVAVEPSAVEGGIVHVGEATAAVQPDGSFEIKGLPSGPTTVTVEAASHETSTGIFVLVAGANAETMSLSLTPKATYQRYYDAYSFRRYKAAYKYLHHDMLRKEPYKTFKKDMDLGTSISLKMGAQRVLRSWRSGVTKRTYHDVVEIDRAYVYEWFGRKYTEKISQHWVKVKGIWYIVWDLT